MTKVGNGEIIDLSEYVGPESIAWCPICDNGILDFEPVVLVFAHRWKGLAHTKCVKKVLGNNVV